MAIEKKELPLCYQRFDEDEMRERSAAFLQQVRSRRSVRSFSEKPVPIDVIERCIESAAQAPSGANKQPWTFVLVTDVGVKRRIREAAEKEEKAFYSGRASARWLQDLEVLGTGPEKPFLEQAPALIALFAQRQHDRAVPGIARQ